MPDESLLHSPDRRHWLQAGLLGAGSLAGACALPAWAQPDKATAGRPLTVAQIVDYSQAQQDVAKDFLIGSRAAWQDINAKGGIRGRTVQHLALETDGTAASLRTALQTAKDTAGCVALSGTVGDQLAAEVTRATVQAGANGIDIAHAAPWLQNSGLDIGDRTFPIFAARQDQIAYALKTLSVMGMRELGAVYGTPQDHSAYHVEVERIAGVMKLQLKTFTGKDDLRSRGLKLTPDTPAVLLFVGGTPELAEFTQGLQKQARQRYVVALADVNLQTMAQMGAARNTPVIATQPVPLANASLPIVRLYRDTMSRLFDEPPAPLSLAGFIAARYTYEVLASVQGDLTRQSALAAFQRRASIDVGGFRVTFDETRRSTGFVTQSMMTLDGRLIG